MYMMGFIIKYISPHRFNQTISKREHTNTIKSSVEYRIAMYEMLQWIFK